MHRVAVLFDSLFDAVADIKRIVRVPWIVRSNRHDRLRQQVVVPLQHVELGVTDHPAWGFDGERGTRVAYRRLLSICLVCIDPVAIDIFALVETIAQPKPYSYSSTVGFSR